jgi:hypothetical protein
MNKNIIKIVIPIIVLVCGVLIGVIISQQSFFAENFSFLNKDILSSEKAGERALDYINQNILKDSDLTASLIGEPVIKNGVYELKLKISDSEFNSYLTRDGRLLFPEAIVLEEEDSSKDQNSVGCENVKKEQKPVLEAFVVAYCPFGTQMQRILVEIIKNIPELSENIRIEYMGQIQDGKITAMHGEKEAQENLTQICLREEENSKYFAYLSCFLKKGDNQGCLKEAGVDQEKLEGCKNDESRGLTYAQKDFDLQNKHQITGSPALILNGQNISEFDFGGRTAEAVKTLLCCGFEGNLAYCDKPLTEEQAATGFSETYGSGESGSGSCN